MLRAKASVVSLRSRGSVVSSVIPWQFSFPTTSSSGRLCETVCFADVLTPSPPISSVSEYERGGGGRFTRTVASVLLLRVWSSVGVEVVCLAIGWFLTTTIALKLPYGFGMRQTRINLPQAKRKMSIVCEDIRGQSAAEVGQYRQQRPCSTRPPRCVYEDTRKLVCDCPGLPRNGWDLTEARSLFAPDTRKLVCLRTPSGGPLRCVYEDTRKLVCLCPTS